MTNLQRMIEWFQLFVDIISYTVALENGTHCIFDVLLQRLCCPLFHEALGYLIQQGDTSKAAYLLVDVH